MRKIIISLTLAVLSLTAAACAPANRTVRNRTDLGINNVNEEWLPGVDHNTTKDTRNLTYGDINGTPNYARDITGVNDTGTAVRGILPGQLNADNIANQGTAQGITVNNLADGKYIGKGDKNTLATVTVQGGKITGVLLERMNDKGAIIDDRNANLGSFTGGGNTSNTGQTKQHIANAIIRAQSADVVTSTTGDTDIVNDWKLAARRAIDQARFKTQKVTQ